MLNIQSIKNSSFFRLPTTSLFAILAAYFSLFVLALADNIRGPLFPELLSYFQVSNTLGSSFFGIASFSGFVGSYFAQDFMKKFGVFHSLKIAAALMGLGLFLIAMSREFIYMQIAAFIFGYNFGFMGVLQNFLVNRFAPKEQLSRYQAGLHSMFGLASFLAPFMVGLTVSASGVPNDSWRVPFLICAGAAVFLFLGLFFQPTIEDIPEQKHLQEKMSSKVEMIFYACLLSSYVLVEILVSSRMALYMRSEFQASIDKSSLMTSLFFLLLLLGRVVFIFWQPRVSLLNQMILSSVATFLILVAGQLIDPWFFVLSGITMAPFYPLSAALCGHLFSKQLEQATSIMLATSSAFIVSMHLTTGFLTDLFGIKGAMWLAPSMTLVTVLLCVLFPVIFKRKIA